MKISLNGAGLNAGGLGFAEYVDLAARHGFDGVDFGIGSARKFADERGGAGAVRDLLAEKKVAPAVFGLEVDWRGEEAAFENGLNALKAQAAFAREIGATRAMTWLPPSVSMELGIWEAQAVSRFRTIARILGDHGIRLGLEWVGPKHLRVGERAMGPHLWVHTLDGTWALIKQIGEKNVGLVVDSYHTYTTGIGKDEIANLSDDKIVHVHVNDVRKGVGPDDAKDGERLLPGEGDIDLASFLDGLRAAGYTGFIAAEVLAPQPIAGDAETATARVRAALKKIGL